MNKQFELLAPGGDLDSIMAAIVAGADAVYCGLDRFNARNRASNLSLNELITVTHIAHQFDCKIFLTLNIMMLDSEFPALYRLLNRLIDTEIDGVIVQDLGLAYLLKQNFPVLDVHISTQMNTHNKGQIEFASQLGCSRVNLSRELNIDEIAELAEHGKKHNVAMEVFVHGSYCIGFSGLCYISSYRNGASGNRGRCSQPCRERFETTAVGQSYPMNLKDNSAYLDMLALAEAGVYSLKIEGRIKKSHYVYTVVDNWRKQLDYLAKGKPLRVNCDELYTVFNRDFTNGYLQGEIAQDMYIESPRNFAPNYALNQDPHSDLTTAKRQVYDKNTQIIELVNQEIAPLKEEFALTHQQEVSLKGAGDKVNLPIIDIDSQAVMPQLSLLCSSFDQVSSLAGKGSDIFLQLPNALRFDWQRWLKRFQDHPYCYPYFPAVLIGQDYEAALTLLDQLKPDCLITDNLGIAHYAQQKEISWIAGPQLNISNSYALLCLKEAFKASGAFISNELNAKQMKSITRPANMRLFFSIYRPNTLLTSRHCLFMQSSGCKKNKLTSSCIRRCEKYTSIINLNDAPYIVNKRKGEYNQLIAQHHSLNLDVVVEMGHLYSDFLIDVREIQTQTQSKVSLMQLVDDMQAFVAGSYERATDIKAHFSHVSNAQYQKGI